MDSNLREVLMAPAIMGSLGSAVYFFTKAVTDFSLKKRMIEKGYVNEDTQAIFKKQQSLDGRYPTLKWGLITFFAGLSLILMEYIPTYPDSPLPYGLFSVSVSLGFLLYYFIVKREQK